MDWNKITRFAERKAEEIEVDLADFSQEEEEEALHCLIMLLTDLVTELEERDDPVAPTAEPAEGWKAHAERMKR